MDRGAAKTEAASVDELEQTEQKMRRQIGQRQVHRRNVVESTKPRRLGGGVAAMLMANGPENDSPKSTNGSLGS